MDSKGAGFDYDYIVIGSGFGGSVSALRLSEKGYKVLVIEKGKWLDGKDFPKTNWNLPKWLWMPFFRFYGLFKITFFRHITVLSGVGVGGGSLVYANTLPVPQKEFFNSGSWKHLADWENELKPYYSLAHKMLGAEVNPKLVEGDLALKKMAQQMGIEDQFRPTKVAVYFGEAGRTVKDPYFEGKGPDRTGCVYCGGCMLGCRFNSKNTLDKNYLWLAQQLGAEIKAESEVMDVQPLSKDGGSGYEVSFQSSTSLFKKKSTLRSRGVVFSGGVMGTVNLLLKLKKKSLPNISKLLGKQIRTNNEALIGITTFNKETDFSKGIAIGSILHTDESSHLEPVRYSAGSGFWRLMMAPMTHGKNIFIRFIRIIIDFFKHPINNLKVIFTRDFSRSTQILLFMQHLDSTLQFKKSWFGMGSTIEKGKKPSAFIPEAQGLAKNYGEIVDGKPMVLASESLLGIPTTAHILGGCPMGENENQGVIDKDNKVFGYKNMYVCDGSMISANPGVNPSLSITAISERAMSQIPSREQRKTTVQAELENGN